MIIIVLNSIKKVYTLLINIILYRYILYNFIGFFEIINFSTKELIWTMMCTKKIKLNFNRGARRVYAHRAGKFLH